MRVLLVVSVAAACSHPATPTTSPEAIGGTATLRWNYSQPNEARFDARDDLPAGRVATYSIVAPPVLPDAMLWLEVRVSHTRPEVPLALEVRDGDRHVIAPEPVLSAAPSPTTLLFVHKGPLTKFTVEIRAATAVAFVEPVELRVEVVATARSTIRDVPADAAETPCNANDPDFGTPACCRPIGVRAKVYAYDGTFAKISLGEEDGVVAKTPGMIDDAVPVYVANVLSAHESRVMITDRTRVDAAKITAGTSLVRLSLPPECRQR